MKKKLVKAVSLVLVVLFAFPFAATAKYVPEYTIESPYEDVVWEGDGAYTAYKANLHTHSYVSDADEDYYDMIMEYYKQGYGVLAMTDHAVTGKPWNEKPTELPLYLYQKIIGNNTTWLSDEEYAQVQSGEYPVEGEARGFGMTYVPGGNELNGLTITKDHVNGLFLPENAGDNYLGYENDYEGAVRLADYYGAVSFINHPGDWLDSRDHRENASDPKYVSYFADILLRYDSCLGMEVFNENNGVTPNDRELWDNLLMACLPYGKNVIGFSNGDTHDLEDVDSSFSVFMMKDNSIENVKDTIINGNFFMVTRKLAADPEKFGPKEPMNAKNTDLAYPMFSSIKVDGHKITIKCTDAYNIQWVANGNIIDTKDIVSTPNATEYTIDLDKIEGAEDFLYVRCQLLGEGGITLTQAFVINDGTEPEEYVRDNSPKAILGRVWRQFLGLRIFALIKIIARKLED